VGLDLNTGPFKYKTGVLLDHEVRRIGLLGPTILPIPSFLTLSVHVILLVMKQKFHMHHKNKILVLHILSDILCTSPTKNSQLSANHVNENAIHYKKEAVSVEHDSHKLKLNEK
jgi:hypothetical protein